MTGKIRACNQLALRPTSRATELRRELIRLLCLITAHRYWAQHGWSTTGRIELVRAAESGPEGIRKVGVRWSGEEFVVAEPGARAS
ncbi:hypothetical protein ABZ743_30715 [Streptomyces sp. NPDC006662]|uniref:hypothetical protein n=1 Tax=Streptomyces sp. NPDC006662 TaxID=3156902 RepID=UPI0033E69F64